MLLIWQLGISTIYSTMANLFEQLETMTQVGIAETPITLQKNDRTDEKNQHTSKLDLVDNAVGLNSGGV